MTWAKNLQQAAFRGVVFDIVKTDDSADYALAEHSYPYVDGADIEDMGRGPRRINVEAVFFGDDYEERLQTFLGALAGIDSSSREHDARLGGYLTHPVFGVMFVQVSRYTIRHDAENPDYASLVIDFIESTPSQPFFNRAFPTQKSEAISQHGTAATVFASVAAASVIARLRAANPLAALDTLRDKLTAPLLKFASTTSLVLSGLDVLAYPRAWGNDISALVGNILDVREWGEQLEADWASIRSDLNAFSIFSTQPSPAPTEVTSSNAPTETQAVAVVAVTIQVNAAVGLGNAVSRVLDGEAATPTMPPDQIETICNAARGAIESAIEQARTVYGLEQSRTITESLKYQALAVQEAAQAIITGQPALIQRTVDAPGNMRLLAHLWYGSHNRAAELYRLNIARSPFVNAGDRINAYAR